MITKGEMRTILAAMVMDLRRAALDILDIGPKAGSPEGLSGDLMAKLDKLAEVDAEIVEFTLDTIGDALQARALKSVAKLLESAGLPGVRAATAEDCAACPENERCPGAKMRNEGKANELEMMCSLAQRPGAAKA